MITVKENRLARLRAMGDACEKARISLVIILESSALLMLLII